jgi:hypothetical protein
MGSKPSGFVHLPIINSGDRTSLADSRRFAEILVRSFAKNLAGTPTENTAPVTSTTASSEGITPVASTNTTTTTDNTTATSTTPNPGALGSLGSDEDLLPVRRASGRNDNTVNASTTSGGTSSGGTSRGTTAPVTSTSKDCPKTRGLSGSLRDGQ